MKKVILIDVDGVIVDFVEAFMYLYRFHGGEVPDDFEWVDWDSMDTLPDQQVRDHVWRDRDLFWISQPYDGAIQALFALNQKFDVRIVTAIPHIHVPTRSDWFHYHAPFIHRKNQMIFTSDKSIIRGDYLVEDSMHNLGSWIAINVRSPISSAFLVDRPWNKEMDEIYGRYGSGVMYKRVESLASVAEELGV